MIVIHSPNLDKYPHTPTLTRDEEAYHTYRAQYYNDSRSADLLISSNTAWAKTYTQQYAVMRHIKENRSELLAAAVLGLHHAVKSFNPEYGYRFSSYANAKMFEQMELVDRSFRDDSSIYFPRSARSLYHKVIAKQESMTKKRLEHVPIDVAAHELNISPNWTRIITERSTLQMIPYSKRLSSYFLERHDFQTNFEETIPANTPSPDDELNDAQCAGIIDDALDTLPAQATYILSEVPVSGVSTAGETLASIGLTMNLSRERVRQISEQAKQKLYRYHNLTQRRKYIDNPRHNPSPSLRTTQRRRNSTGRPRPQKSPFH